MSRTRRTVAIFDSGEYRNANTLIMNNVLGNDGTDPAEFRTSAREQLLNRFAPRLWRRGNRLTHHIGMGIPLSISHVRSQGSARSMLPMDPDLGSKLKTTRDRNG